MGIILEDISSKRLKVSATILWISLLACFLYGGVSIFIPVHLWNLPSTVCLDENPNSDNDIRWCPEHYKTIDLEEHTVGFVDTFYNQNFYDFNTSIVFATELPYLRRFDSPWRHIFIEICDISVMFETERKEDPVLEFTFDIRLAYSNGLRYSKLLPWQYDIHRVEKRYMDCTFKNETLEKKGYLYVCTTAPLLDIDVYPHPYSLLNVRLSYNDTAVKNLGAVRFCITNVSSSFMKLWVGSKTFFFLVVISIMVWFSYRIRMVNCVPTLLQYMLIPLGTTLALLDLPIEYLSLALHVPWIRLLNGLCLAVFYAVLLSFWLVFAKEHMLIKDDNKRNSLYIYWKELSSVAIGCICLCIINLCASGIQLLDPVQSIWMPQDRNNLSFWFIALACIFSLIYFILLCYLIWRVFNNINSSSLSKQSQARLLYYNGTTDHFKSVMWVTTVCAATTIVCFILSQTIKMTFKRNKDVLLQATSALYTGAFGMWNIYVCAILIYYAPSHIRSENEEESEHLSTNGLCCISKKMFLDNPVIKYSFSKMTGCWSTFVRYWQDIGIQKIIQNDKPHSVSQDIAKLMRDDAMKDTLIDCMCGEGERPISAHSFIIKCRSTKLGNSLLIHEIEENENIRYKLELTYLSHDVVNEIIHYIYTDSIENPKKYSPILLPLSIKLQLPGLTAFCERYLMESLTSTNADKILQLAEECNSNILKKASLIYLTYCGNSEAESLLPT